MSPVRSPTLFFAIFFLSFFHPSSLRAAPASLKAVDLDNARKIFNRFASDTSIAFHLPESGCEKRSYLMKKALADDGVDTESFVIVSNSPQSFKIELSHPYAPNGKVSWFYHTAPLIEVSLNGEITPYIIDPSLFEGPVPLQAALDKLDPKHSCSAAGAAELKNRFRQSDDFDSNFGSGPCYWFRAPAYFYSPMEEDLSIHEQLEYTCWDMDRLESSRETMNDCREEQQARIEMVRQNIVPKKGATCLFD